VILDQIVAYKKKEIAGLKKEFSADNFPNTDRGGKQGKFAAALRTEGEVALIAEIKKASPSKGIIREDFDPAAIAQIYSAAGASAISVLTDREFFMGSPSFLATARKVSLLPLLRKDFIIDSCQIYEACSLGADAILIIMAILDDREAGRFFELASSLGMECLVEVHTGEEMERALALGARIIGINNRNLNTFKTDLTTTFRLIEKISDPRVTVVSESGINSRDDVLRLKEHGVHAMLVGEALMREKDIANSVTRLLGRDTGS